MLNEDDVPINEDDAKNYWRGYAKECGIYTAVVENIGTSLPDLFMIYKSIVIFQEIKVRRGNLIYAPSFQWSNMNQLARELHDWQLIYVVYNKGTFDLYTYKDIKSLPDTMVKGTNYGKVKMDLSSLSPFISIFDSADFGRYIAHIHMTAFRKPLSPASSA